MTARGIFLISGIWGILVVAPFYFLEGWVGRQAPPPVNHPEYYYGFVGVTLVWQILLLVIASNPTKYRPIMLLAILEKLSYGVAAPMLFANGRVPAMVLVAGLIDLAWAVLFAVALGKTPRAQS
jgi:hypothetical protein